MDVPGGELPPSVRIARDRRSRPSSDPGSRRRAYPAPAGDEDLGAAALQLAATRALLTARTPDEVAAVVATFVHDLGGGLLPARLDAGGTALPIDVSLGLSEPKLPWADPLSVATMRLMSLLPGFLEDARTVLGRLQAEERRHDRER